MAEESTAREIPRITVWGEALFFCANCSHWESAEDELLDTPGVCYACTRGEHPDPRLN